MDKLLNDKEFIDYADRLLSNPSLPSTVIEQLLELKREALENIETEFLITRRKKINKLLGIPDVKKPMTEKQKEMMRKINEYRKNNETNQKRN